MPSKTTSGAQAYASEATSRANSDAANDCKKGQSHDVLTLCVATA